MYWCLLGGWIWVKRDKGKALGGENGQVVLRENGNDGYAGGMNVENVVYASERVDVVHGRWIYIDRQRKCYRQYTGFDAAGETHTITVLEESKGKEPYCSECGAQAAESFMDFCPRCGAKMDGDGGTEDGTVS